MSIEKQQCPECASHDIASKLSYEGEGWNGFTVYSCETVECDFRHVDATPSDLDELIKKKIEEHDKTYSEYHKRVWEE